MARVTLTPLATGDIPAITAAMQQPEVIRWLPALPQPYTAADAEAFVTRIALPSELAIRVDGAFAGTIRIGPELGYWLAPGFQGRGIATRAAVLGLSRHFDDPAAGPARAAVAEANARSARVLARLGFEDAGPTRLAGAGDWPARALRLTRARFAALHPPVIETARTRIAPPVPADLPGLRVIATRPEVARMLFIFSADMTEAEFAASHPAFDAARPFRLAIRTEAGLAGSIGVGQGERAEIAYFLDPALAGQGLASEVVPAFCAEILDRFGLSALTAEVFDDNPASARVLEKAGFVRDGPSRHASRGRGAEMSSRRFSLHRDWVSQGRA